MAIEGSNILLLVNTGTSTDTNFEPVAKQTSLDTENSRNIIDASYKQADHEKGVYGKQAGTLTLEKLYVLSTESGTDSMEVLRDAVKNKKLVVLRRMENEDKVEEVEGKISDLSEDYPDDDVSQVTVDFDKFGPWTSISGTDIEASFASATASIREASVTTS